MGKGLFQAIRSMVKECDFVVVTVPLTSQTRGLIDQDVFKSMKPSAFLVDVSRGDVVDQSALIEALEEKEIAGLALAELGGYRQRVRGFHLQR